jgi:hypothetical protein
MPTINITFTIDELFSAAVGQAREMSDRILKLADIEKTPLTPGESVDNRRHQIAKMGKLLAQAFIAIDDLMRTAADERERAHANDVTADVPKPIDPEAN